MEKVRTEVRVNSVVNLWVIGEMQWYNYFLCVYVGIELDKLDAEMIKLLAWQRIQQLFPPKVPSTPTPIAPAAAPKSPLPCSESKTSDPAV